MLVKAQMRQVEKSLLYYVVVVESESYGVIAFALAALSWLVHVVVTEKCETPHPA